MHIAYSIQIKLHTIQLSEVGKAKDPRKEKTACQIKFDRQDDLFIYLFIFISFTRRRFLIPATKLTIVACGQFLAVEDAGSHCMQGDCEDIFCHSSIPFRGGGGRRSPGENDEAAITQNVHLALPTSSTRAFWESERLG